jgi:hypothetical protein
MRYIIYLLIYFSFVSHLFAFNCTLSNNGDICCAQTCSSCGGCIGNITVDELCCATTIKNSSVYCYQSNQAPCILGNDPNNDQTNTNQENQEDQENEIQKFVHWIRTAKTYAIVIFAVCVTLVLLFCCYACCCFGSKSPPISYELIVGKVGLGKDK